MPRVCVWYVRQRVMVAVHHEMIKFNNCKSPSILHVRYHSLGLKTWHKQCENNVYWNTCHFTQPCENFSVPESSSLSFQCFSNLISIELLYEVGRGICWNPWDNIVHLEVEHFLANLAQIFNCFIKAYCENYWNHKRSHNEPPINHWKHLYVHLWVKYAAEPWCALDFKLHDTSANFASLTTML